MASLKNLDLLLEAWARWCVTGEGGFGAGSVLGRLIDFKGNEALMYGAGGGKAPADEIEARVEAAVMALAASDKKAAEVIRAEYGVGWFADDETERLGQIGKAHRLAVSIRTYHRKLKKAKEHVLEALTGTRHV
ncbi:hypothetical protein [Endozoicomonas montiporae]|uniref:hypothetical protein n=1 Tax=Endozoicomonas montiporae TaxID=1027273 RepID=UPI0006910B9E|nr:hypothetical protein [Endozoicomonas montiporae]